MKTAAIQSLVYIRLLFQWIGVSLVRSISPGNAHSFTNSKGKFHVPSTSKPSKEKFLLILKMAKFKVVFQEVDSTVVGLLK